MGAMTQESRMQDFQTPGPARLRVDIPKGRIKVMAEQTEVTRIELVAIHGDATAKAWIADAEVAERDGEIVVRIHKTGLTLFGMGGSVEARIHAPFGSAAVLSTGSGRIETTGRLGEVSASSGSGAICLDECEQARARAGSGDITIVSSTGLADAKTGSGRITVGHVGGDARINTASGHAELAEAVGDAKVNTGSGHIEVGQAGDSLEAFAASGNVQVRRADHGRVRARTFSGHVYVGVAKGTAALLDVSTMSGRVKSQLEAAAAPAEGEKRVELVISTMSGNVDVVRA
jgi:DUF4097 and DUF4098 domain-containing protein YvlB